LGSAVFDRFVTDCKPQDECVFVLHDAYAKGVRVATSTRLGPYLGGTCYALYGVLAAQYLILGLV
jgi:hypothetical protein